jgi:hypothetical protein
MVFGKLEGRTPPPAGGARLALVEGGRATGDDDDFDPGADEGFEEDED